MSPVETFIRRLKVDTDLHEEHARLIRELPIVERHYEHGDMIVRGGDRPSHCGLVVEGLVVRAKSTDDGKRQILSLHIAGDIPDLQSLYLHVMDHDVVAQSACRMGMIPHAALRPVLDRCAPVMRSLWRETLIEAAILREWILNVGRRSAERRMTHLLLEHFRRLHAIGLAEGDTFAFPLTQTELGDALGLTPVHVNRVLKSLREAGVMDFRRSSVRILDRERLVKIAGFTDVYLHQHPAL